MTVEKPIMISNIRWIMYLMVGFIIALGILIFKLVGLDKMISNFNDSPIAFGLTLMFLIGLFFMLPLILLLFLKKIKIFKSRLVIFYPFRLKSQIVDFFNVDSFKTYEGNARGITFTEICIKLKNDNKIKFNSISNTNFKKCISTLSKNIKK
tara:strand:+ start:6833 stop:7288 length:456 start_codon:yes stop_codon:yes gene_type:complete